MAKIYWESGETGVAMLSSDIHTALQSSVSSKTQERFVLCLPDVPHMKKNFPPLDESSWACPWAQL